MYSVAYQREQRLLDLEFGAMQKGRRYAQRAWQGAVRKRTAGKREINAARIFGSWLGGPRGGRHALRQRSCGSGAGDSAKGQNEPERQRSWADEFGNRRGQPGLQQPVDFGRRRGANVQISILVRSQAAARRRV